MVTTRKDVEEMLRMLEGRRAALIQRLIRLLEERRAALLQQSDQQNYDKLATELATDLDAVTDSLRLWKDRLDRHF